MGKREFGVLYFVNKNPGYKEMMDYSIRSIKKFHPDWEIEIIESESYSTPIWIKAYRALSFWKWSARKKRSNMDIRVILDKALAMLDSPFENTLYIDVDTVVLKSLSSYKELLNNYDVIATPLSWKMYNGFDTWHPVTFPMVMAGVVFYNNKFKTEYSKYVEALYKFSGQKFDKGDDQYIFSMACELEKNNLNILLDPYLQIDAMNLAQHLGNNYRHNKDGVLDLTCKEIQKFHIFHYNGPNKLAYKSQIKTIC